MPLPRYKDVPPEWKKPFGPYVQAPAEFGAEWWYVYPFNPEPWKSEGPVADNAPPDFVAVFGPRPHIRDPFYGEWEQNRKAWKGVGLPEWMTQEQLNTANAIFEAWGMGKGVVYEGRYGYSARFPATKKYDFEAAAYNLLNTAHLVVADFQIRSAQEGMPPAKWHPFVPPQVRGENPQ